VQEKELNGDLRRSFGEEGSEKREEGEGKGRGGEAGGEGIRGK
jgi:hypothetical protein